MHPTPVSEVRALAAGFATALAFACPACRLPPEIQDGPGRPDADGASASTCYLPGDRVDPDVTVEDIEGRPIRLGDLIAADESRGVVIYLLGGAAGNELARGFWCEDTWNDLPILRHVVARYEGRGLRFVAVACPPVYGEARYGYDGGSFLARPDDDGIYQANRRRFVERTVRLRDDGAIPRGAVLAFDPRFRLLANSAKGEASTVAGPRPTWQGRFKWHADPQTYGTPTIWILDRDLEVFGEPFFLNVYTSRERTPRYSAADVTDRLEKLLDGREP